MDLEQRLKQLESHHDWQGLTEALEQGLAAAQDQTVKAELHLRLGRLLYGQFLQGVRALKHFQDAFKLNPALIEALGEARGIYWELGKLNMVQKLLELQLKSTQDAPTRTALFRELGDVLCDAGDYDRATEAYAKALQSAEGKGTDAGERLADVQANAEDWQDRVGELLRTAHEAVSAAAKSDAFIRASRIARRFAPTEFEGILAQAYVADPTSVKAAAIYEGLLVETERTEQILETQRESLKALTESSAKAALGFVFGARWAVRHQNSEVSAQLFEDALRLDPSLEPAFTFLKDAYGTKGGDFEAVIRLADELSDRAGLDGRGAYLLANAGLLAWRERGDLIRARRFFERLARIDAEHPALVAFEAQIGEKLGSGSSSGSGKKSKAPKAASEPPAEAAPAPS